MTEKKRVRLGAALINGDHGRLAYEVERLEKAGLDFVHMDVYDGHFTSFLGFPPQTISALRPLKRLPFEVHLGTNDPIRFIPALSEAGADLIMIHIESIILIQETIFKTREHNVKVGLALTLGTPLSRVEPVIPFLDTVLLISRPLSEGTYRAQFDSSVIPRVRRVHEMAQAADVNIDIQVVGGITPHHILVLISAGAKSLAFGRSIYQVPDMAKEVAKIRTLADQT